MAVGPEPLLNIFTEEGCEVDPKYHCSICFGVLSDAHLTECCGQHYCKSCLAKWKKTCPQCRQENFTFIRNKSLIREIQLRSNNKTPFPAGSGANTDKRFSCVICKVEPVIDPCLTDCCGQHSCQPCLTQWLLQTRPKKTCPHCAQENFVHILNKSLKREIDEVFVRCVHLGDGCMWRGQREALAVHLHFPSSSAESCEYVIVECPFKLCYRKFMRRDLEKHTRVCQYRPEECTHCGLTVPHTAINLHHDECPEIVLSCPNRCSQREMKRRDLLIHYQTCPLEPLDCQFKDAGCSDRILREEMESHVEKKAQHHMMLLQKQNRALRAQNVELRRRNRSLHKWNGELNDTLERLAFVQ